jgi:dihydroorotate dehydrogenase
MPDWSYHTLFYPLLGRLRGHVARDLTLQAVGALAALPGGPGLIATFGHMDPPAGLAASLAGLALRSPLGIAGELDPRLLGTAGLARFGVGFIEVGPVTVSPAAETHGPRLSADGQSVVLDRLPASIGLHATCARLQSLGRLVCVPLVVRIAPDTPEQLATLMGALEEPAAAFVLDVQSMPLETQQRMFAARPKTRRPLLVGLAADAPTDVVRSVVRLGLAAGVDGWVVSGGVRQADGSRIIGPVARERTVATLHVVRQGVPQHQPVLVEAGVTEPADALRLRAAGADLVLLHSGLVTAGPGLPKRINEALADPLVEHTTAWRWLVVLGLSMLLGGVLAWLIAATRVVLPYDEAYLGLGRDALQAVNPRLLAFMAHDRVTLAGTMLSVGALYTGLAGWGVRRGAHWAWLAIVCSALVGFASFFLFLGFGYFDPLHAAVSVVLLALFALGLRGAPKGLGPHRRDLHNDRTWQLGLWGQLGFVSLGIGLVLAGVGIALVGVGGVLVEEDLAFLRAPAGVLGAVNPHLMPLVAHDRAGFGGALVSDGIGVLLTSLWGFRAGARWVWWTLLGAGLPGFAAALGVHVAVGYLDPVHLAPAIAGALLFVLALGLSYPFLYGPTRVAPSIDVASGIPTFS